MSQTNLDAIYGKIDSLPALPATVSKVLEVTGDPESSANDLMRAVLPDQSMCATILKIANSAFFGLPREVNTIEKAVMVLGFDEVKNIVLGKAVFNSFKEINGDNAQAIEALWSHAFTCGLAAKIIGERIDISPSEMFVAGLIHDIGKIAMLTTFPSIYSHLLKNNQIDWQENYRREAELFLICHDAVARRILKRWLFPSRLTCSVGYHHRPQEAGEMRLPASCIEVADIIAHVYQDSAGLPAADPKALVLELKPNALDYWQELALPCSSAEIITWFKLLGESLDKDTAILSIFRG